MQAACRARSSTKRGKWRGACAGSSAAGASSTSVAGHGLLAQALLILDDTSPGALVVDMTLPPSAAKLHRALVEAWPRLDGRVEFVTAELDTVETHDTDLVVSSHACGRLTDVVLDRAVSARARVAVLPCCHHLRDRTTREALSGWVDRATAVDVLRAASLARAPGYRVWTQTIPAGITPKNRLLLGEPLRATD